MPKTDRLIIHKMDQADAQQFLASVNDGDEMTDYLNVLLKSKVLYHEFFRTEFN